VLTEHSVAEAAAAAGLPGPATYVETTGSTNADLLAAGDAGAPAWSVRVAGHQIAGRGRLGRSWEAPSGSSLLVSVLLRPSLAPHEAPLLSLAVAVAMGEAIEEASGVAVRCAWPNDLTTGDGRKLAGVLAESRIEDGRLLHVVVGVGVNLTQTAADFPEDLRRPATSLALEGATPEAASLLHAFLERLHGAYAPDREGFAADVLAAYRPRCSTVGRQVRATGTDGTVIEGDASDIGSNGELIIATGAGPIAVASGEVEGLG
jgi:BirA family biotin operon repressor/biotin-[acetyl-CoA-carboxylase] ligase